MMFQASFSRTPKMKLKSASEVGLETTVSGKPKVKLMMKKRIKIFIFFVAIRDEDVPCNILHAVVDL